MAFPTFPPGCTMLGVVLLLVSLTYSKYGDVLEFHGV